MLRRPPRSTLFPTRRSSDLEGQLLTLVEVARRQMLMGHDGRVELGVGADLGVVRVGAGLLAARPRNRVEIGVAEDGGADRVDDLELELAERQRTAGATAAWGDRATCEGDQRDHDGELEYHASAFHHVHGRLNVTRTGTKSTGHAYSCRMANGRSNL